MTKVDEVYKTYGINYSGGVGDGWAELLNKMFYTLRRLGWTGTEVAQIKEKFGVLRVYIDDLTDEQYNLVITIENLSKYVCEDCGQPGKLVQPRYWMRTLCSDCEVKFVKVPTSP